MNNSSVIEKKEVAKMEGVYTFTLAKLVTPEHFALDAQISHLQKQGLHATALPLIKRLNAMCETEVTVVKNLIPTVGRSAIANWLTQASPSPASIRLNYTALGTGATAPANGDTQLQTETYRKAIASATNSNNVAYCTAFYTAPETSGTYTEAGIFMNATGTANSGTIFSRVAISITKTTSNTLTIDYTITIS